jgi:hypothetical protein
MIERAEDSQLAALRAFTLLTALRSHCPGGLILACGLEPRGAALMIAGNIAGACCLAIEERAEVTRATLRSGASDFVVNSVDEALRVLKNEVRQGRPLSVGLTMAVEPALTELLERGVLPEVFTAFDRVHATAVSWAAMEFAAMGLVCWRGCCLIDSGAWSRSGLNRAKSCVRLTRGFWRGFPQGMCGAGGVLVRRDSFTASGRIGE